MQQRLPEPVPPPVNSVFLDICAVVRDLPERIETTVFVFGEKIPRDVATSWLLPNCHLMSHALGRLFSLDVHDGVIGIADQDGCVKHFEHSWLTVRGWPQFIIDPWPLGSVAGPNIFLQNQVFHFGNEVCWLFMRTEEFESKLEDVHQAMVTVRT